jgi:hypothetical protein
MILKNNKNIKILLPVVILIWGVLIYKIVDAFTSEDVNVAKTQKTNFSPPTETQKDTFSLLPIKTDPFLGTVYSKLRQAAQNVNTPHKPKTEQPWPDIGYFGIVADKKSTSSVYIVSVNGRQFLLKEGDTIQKLKVLKGSEENISIRFEGQTKEFPIM